MSRFIEVGNQSINVDKVIRVIKSSHSASIILEDGQRVDVDRRTVWDIEGLYKEIEGNSHIANVMKAPNELYAVYAIDDEEGNRIYEAKKVRLLALLSDGHIESVDLFEGNYELCTVCSDYIGTYTNDQIARDFCNVQFI